jgi:hypothetical protein
MLMFIGSLLTLMAIGGFPSFVEDMKVSFFSCSIYNLYQLIINSLL